MRGIGPSFLTYSAPTTTQKRKKKGLLLPRFFGPQKIHNYFKAERRLYTPRTNQCPLRKTAAASAREELTTCWVGPRQAGTSDRSSYLNLKSPRRRENCYCALQVAFLLRGRKICSGSTRPKLDGFLPYPPPCDMLSHYFHLL